MADFFNVAVKSLHDLNIISVVVRILLSVLAGSCIGFERGRYGRAAGLRTHILIALGACMSSMVGTYMVTEIGVGGDPSRIASGVVSGIGFLCAGIILIKSNSKVTGLTTAAAMWATATVGLAIGAGFYSAGIIATVVLFLCLTFMTVVEIRQKRDRRFIVEIDDAREINNIIDQINEKYPNAHSFDVFPARSSINGYIDLAVNITYTDKTDIETLLALPHVVFVLDE